NTALYLEEGRLTYAGELEGAIGRYAGSSRLTDTHRDFSGVKHEGNMGKLARMTYLDLNNVTSNEYEMGGGIDMTLGLEAVEDVKNLRVSALISRPGSGVVASSFSGPVYTANAGQKDALSLRLPLGGLGPGEYDAALWLCFIDPIGRMVSYDVVPNAFRFSVGQNLDMNEGMLWNEKRHGIFRLPDMEEGGIKREQES
ncbi:MAG: hypothetical protein IKX84_09135, partial [Clostridia bacterium]|nr:hypothetical protein [Clostridia bacterium]